MENENFLKTVLACMVFFSVCLLIIVGETIKPRYVFVEKPCEGCKKKKHKHSE